jgi:hypothetical protein
MLERRRDHAPPWLWPPRLKARLAAKLKDSLYARQIDCGLDGGYRLPCDSFEMAAGLTGRSVSADL